MCNGGQIDAAVAGRGVGGGSGRYREAEVSWLWVSIRGRVVDPRLQEPIFCPACMRLSLSLKRTVELNKNRIKTVSLIFPPIHSRGV